jgi:hypothetical protein
MRPTLRVVENVRISWKSTGHDVLQHRNSSVIPRIPLCLRQIVIQQLLTSTGAHILKFTLSMGESVMLVLYAVCSRESERAVQASPDLGDCRSGLRPMSINSVLKSRRPMTRYTMLATLADA